jgi:hypothetical protein
MVEEHGKGVYLYRLGEKTWSRSIRTDYLNMRIIQMGCVVGSIYRRAGSYGGGIR